MIVSSSGGDFKPIPEGSYTAICVRVIDLGTQVTTYQGADKTQRKVLIAWEVPEVPVEYEGEIKPALVMSRYTASLSDKANLRKHLEAWRGRKFTDDELRGFDLKNVLGKPCLLQVIHSQDGAYANVAAIMAMPKGTTAPEPEHPLLHLSLDKGEFDDDCFGQLSEKMQQLIAQSPEFKALHGGEPVSPHLGGGGGNGGIDMDDEIPFVTSASIW